MSVSIRVISIGTLASHPLWSEKGPARTGHATTTLIRSGKKVILVDPGLPDQAIAARLNERSGLRPADVTDVFLTSFRPDVRRGLRAFEDAEWWIHENEREAFGVPLAQRLKEAVTQGDGEMKAALESEISMLRRCKPAPDNLAPHVSIFPLPGITPGMCGVLIEEPRHTTLVCGDAIATIEHLEQGQVLTPASSVEQARESFAEATEIGDLLVLGRDNMVANPTKRPF